MELYILVEKCIVASKNNVNISAFFGRHLFQGLLGERGWEKHKEGV